MLNTKEKALDGPQCNYKVSGKLWLIPVWSAPKDKFNTNNTLIKSLNHTKHMKILVWVFKLQMSHIKLELDIAVTLIKWKLSKSTA